MVKADGDISEEAENIKAHQVILKTTTSQGSGINPFNIKPGPRLRQYLHSTSRLQQLWSTSAQDAIVNNLRAVQRSCAMRLLGGVVPLLWVVVLVGLVFALPVSVRVPHFPRCRCCMYLEFSVILVSPYLFLLLTQWLCLKSLTRLENPMGCCLSNKH